MYRSFEIFEHKRATNFYVRVLMLLVTPFYLNDFASIFIKDWHLWLFIDYVFVKLFPCVVVLWLIQRKKMQPVEFGLTTQSIPLFLFVFLVVGFVGTIIDQNGYRLLDNLPGYKPLGGMPIIGNSAWNWVDLTIGLLMVGIVEEIVFRGYMYTFLSKFTKQRFLIVVISSIAFGLIHWSLGLHAVLVTSLIGSVFMTMYLITRALPPIMLAHFAINFIDFSGVIPKSVFRFT